ncbi:MAG: hypothetical protein COB93_07205 [Sneathiella sp.]|nr:MAG: hypothetical protein COB93_07205 [Sneathiella sp.]
MPVKLPLISVFLLFLTALSGTAVSAQAGPKDVIGVLDMPAVMRGLDVVQDINAQIDKFEESFKKDFDVRENELKAEKEQIARQKIIVTADAYSKKQVAFNKKAAVYRREAQEKSRQLQQSRFIALEELRKSIIPIIQELMAGFGATMVVDRQELLFADKDLDKTSDVVDELNKRLTKVIVKIVPLKKS